MINRRDLLLVLGLVLCLPGCGRRTERHGFTGAVVEIQPDRRRVVISHGRIPGFMGAMTMSFPVGDTAMLTLVQPGDSVRGVLVEADSGSWLSELRVTRRADAGGVLDRNGLQ